MEGGLQRWLRALQSTKPYSTGQQLASFWAAFLFCRPNVCLHAVICGGTEASEDTERSRWRAEIVGRWD